MAEWRTPILLVLLSLVPVIAGTGRLMGIAAGGPVTADNARFFAMPIPVVLHLLAVIPYSLLGALQFAPALRRRSSWHRRIGKFVGGAGLVTALTGLWMTLAYPWPAGDGVILFWLRIAVGTAMVAALVLGVIAVAQQKIEAHGAWMSRAYALGMGAGTQVLTHLPWFIFVRTAPDELSRAVMMGAGWGINVMVAEWAIRARPGQPGGENTW